jgi:arsenate reductase
MLKVYGITNCTTVQKARKWLEANQLEYEFHDYKKLGIDKEHLQAWCQKFGWETILNRKGMMWRKTSDEVKNKVVDEKSAIEFMLEIPTSIKRPVIESDTSLLIGFYEAEYKEALLK